MPGKENWVQRVGAARLIAVGSLILLLLAWTMRLERWKVIAMNLPAFPSFSPGEFGPPSMFCVEVHKEPLPSEADLDRIRSYLMQQTFSQELGRAAQAAAGGRLTQQQMDAVKVLDVWTARTDTLQVWYDGPLLLPVCDDSLGWGKHVVVLPGTMSSEEAAEEADTLRNELAEAIAKCIRDRLAGLSPVASAPASQSPAGPGPPR